MNEQLSIRIKFMSELLEAVKKEEERTGYKISVSGFVVAATKEKVDSVLKTA